MCICASLLILHTLIIKSTKSLSLEFIKTHILTIVHKKKSEKVEYNVIFYGRVIISFSIKRK